MFKKILIANRGEIACRVIRTARAMGIRTVAVHSEADAGALHVEMADEAVAIGPSPAAQSYLVKERILEACRKTGAEAVHPGYGFLSENTEFAALLETAGIVFIGPTPSAVAAMGDKIESKKLAQKAGVNAVPGHLAAIPGPEEAVKIAREIGYPVMIKASAGGGGKGMRIAFDDGQTREGFVSASNEARSSFGDDRVFIEKFVEQPRHIEIQVLADAHGNCVYLGERECSIQRRHQKVIEEAPSPFLDARTRKAMGEQAVALAKAVDYRSAGTVEFIVDAKRNFYFLEMNTRLQVEHPVTEMVTGIDLVEQMIRVAAGEKLPFGQKDIKLDGWAIEARVYAEDPFRNFLPSIGRLSRLKPPASNGSVRVDTGVVEGSEISMFYDPMIAKLVTWSATRTEAIDAMSRALDAYVIRGIGHNVPFLATLMAHPRFREGRLTTGFIAEEFPDGFQGGRMDEAARDALLAAALFVEREARRRERPAPGPLSPAAERRERVVTLGKERHAVALVLAEGGFAFRRSDGRIVAVVGEWEPGQPLFEGEVDGRPVTVQVDRRGAGWLFTHAGLEVVASVRSPRAAGFAALMPDKPPPDLSKYLLCPMPGLMVAVHVAPGDEVKAGQPLAVVEAMKMENVLRAERDGVVGDVRVKPGDSLAVDQVILEFA